MKLHYKKNRRGISEIIVTVLMVVLVLVSGAVVWAIANGLVKKQTGNIESCFGAMEKITINSEYTCFDDNIAPSPDFLQLSISIGNIDVESAVIGVSGTVSGSYTLTNGTAKTVPGLTPYPSGTGAVRLPAKNGGTTYIANITSRPDSIKIAPTINGQHCDVTDTLTQIENCD